MRPLDCFLGRCSGGQSTGSSCACGATGAWGATGAYGTLSATYYPDASAAQGDVAVKGTIVPAISYLPYFESETSSDEDYTDNESTEDDSESDAPAEIDGLVYEDGEFCNRTLRRASRPGD